MTTLPYWELRHCVTSMDKTDWQRNVEPKRPKSGLDNSGGMTKHMMNSLQHKSQIGRLPSSHYQARKSRCNPWMRFIISAGALMFAITWAGCAKPQNRIPLKVEQPVAGAPLTFGIPFPQGALHSPDHVRVLTSRGREIPSQITEVTTWAPADNSIKWIWVFFFSEESEN